MTAIFDLGQASERKQTLPVVGPEDLTRIFRQSPQHQTRYPKKPLSYFLHLLCHHSFVVRLMVVIGYRTAELQDLTTALILGTIGPSSSHFL